MKTKLTRILALLFALCMVITSFVACSTEEGPKKDSGTTGTTAGAAGGTTGGQGTTGGNNEGDGENVTTGGLTDEEIELKERTDYAPPASEPPREDYLYRMTLSSQYSDYEKYFSSVTGGTSNDVIDVAFFQRNSYLEELYGIEISFKRENSVNIGNFTTSKDDFTDVIWAESSTMMGSWVVNGYLLNMAELDQLNTEASYWDQHIQKDLSINNMFFMLDGDLAIWDEFRTQSVLYNAKLYSDYGYIEEYGSPYQMVRRGDWTLDTMVKMFQGRSDLASGGAMTKDSQWGMISESVFSYVVFMGTGTKLINVNRNGELSSALANLTTYNKVYETLEGVLSQLVGNKEILFANASQGVLSTDSNVYWDEASYMFESDKALFRTTCLSDASYLGNMVSLFGVLPIPKYDKRQDNYYSLCAASTVPVALPATLMNTDHLDFSVEVLDAIGYTSKYMPGGETSVLDAFYEHMAIIDVCRTAEDYEMMELILAQKTYDLDSVLGLSGLYAVVNGFTTGSSYDRLSSELEKISESFEELLADEIETITSKCPNP